MNTPSLSSAALLAIAPLVFGGCTLYSNPSACKAQMREAVASAASAGTLSISHVGVGIGGSRVVVEGTLKSAAPAADASDAASAASAAGEGKPIIRPAAVECMFDGDKLTSLRWLAPPELAPSSADSKG